MNGGLVGMRAAQIWFNLLFMAKHEQDDAPMKVKLCMEEHTIAWAPARGGQGGQPPTLEKIRVGHAHPGNTNRGLKTFRQ